MNFQRLGAIVFALFISTWSFAQPRYTPNVNIPVTQGGNLLKNPWTGGFNAPVFSEIDLNGDGIKDLFAIEKLGLYNRVVTYINDGTPNQVSYHYAPEYRSKFPDDLHDWALLIDYDCDGKEDIFTYSYSGGMTVYKNEYDVSTGLAFSLAYNLVNSDYGTVTANLYVSSVNLPALVDVDYDGDLDVLTFSLAGNFIEYHQNKAQEYFGRCDTLLYELVPGCYGNFALSGASNTAILNIMCRPVVGPVDPGVVDFTQLHSGSCMIAPDIDGDQDRDLLNGDILGNNMLLVINGGDSAYADMVAQDSLFPVYDTSVDLITFPAPYYFDVDNDGNKDFVVAPCISGPSENFNNIWFYKNTTNNTTNVFSYQQNRFLSDEMIEVGAGANVVLSDLDKDGLLDMVIGNYGYFSPIPPFTSKLSYYRNTGTANAPAFELITDDLAGLSALIVTGLAPAFADLDKDGLDDLILGLEDGTLIYYKNTGVTGVTPTFTLLQASLTDAGGNPIDVGQYSTPQLVDVNKDGKFDLLIGEKSGNINYYENTGTLTAPQFNLFSSNLGSVNVNNSLSIYGYSYPCLVDSNGSWQLLVGSVRGHIYQFGNISGNLSGQFQLLDSIYYHINEPMRITVSAGDLNGDGKLDLLTGNYSGGVTIYDYTTTAVPEIVNPLTRFDLFPNPAQQYIVVRYKEHAKQFRTLDVVDITGRIIMSRTLQEMSEVIDLSSFSNGVYTVRICEGQECTSRKFIVNK